MSSEGSEIMQVLQELKGQVQRLADALEKEQDRKAYQKAYYKRRKEAREVEKLGLQMKLREVNCLEGPRDRRLPSEEWAKQLKRFVDAGLSAYNFLTWLTWTWNQRCYKHSPVTTSGGYVHVFIGTSGDRALRQKYSTRELFGKSRCYRFTKPEQLELFREAKWWNWGFGVLGPIVFLVEEEPWFKQLPDNWVRPLRLLMGGFGDYDLRNDLKFDPSTFDLARGTKMYGLARNTLEMCWASCLRGLQSKAEPFPLG